MNGAAPWLLRRRSLLFRADRPVVLGWPPWTGGEAEWSGWSAGFEGAASPYVLIVARGLKVTVRGGRFPRGDVLEGSD